VSGSSFDPRNQRLGPRRPHPFVGAIVAWLQPADVYLGVERKQIPHLRRHIRFLKSDLALPRDFQTGSGIWQDRVNTMAPSIRAMTARFYGWSRKASPRPSTSFEASRHTGREKTLRVPMSLGISPVVRNTGTKSPPEQTAEKYEKRKEKDHEDSRLHRDFFGRRISQGSL
jgi:hypothetical protein